MAVYKMIPRWMPYSIPLYLEPISRVFERLGEKKKDDVVEETPDLVLVIEEFKGSQSILADTQML